MMPASTSRDNAVDAAQPLVHTFELRFATGTKYYCTWTNDLTHGGNTYVGTGVWEQVSQLTFDVTGQMSLMFNAADATLLDEVSNQSRNRLMIWQIGVIDGQHGGKALVGVYPFLALRMAPGPIVSAPGRLDVVLRLLPLTDADRVHAIRTRSHADQRSIDSEDDALRDAGKGNVLQLNRSNFIQKSGFPS